MRDTVRELILQDIVTTLKGIKTADGYNFDVVDVERSRTSPLADTAEFPQIFVYEMSEADALEGTNLPGKFLAIVLQCWVKSGDNDLSKQVNALLADVDVAINKDTTRGGKAVDTSITESVVFIDAGETETLAALHVVVRVHYRTLLGDPYSAR